jgi:hypothetical protein
MQPVQHVASRHSVERPTIPAAAQPPPQIESDPLTSFEYFHFQVRTDLRLWMTFGLEERIEKAKRFSRMNEDPAFKVTPERRHKILNYIIWLESTHPAGHRNPAAVAFNGLFKKEE